MVDDQWPVADGRSRNSITGESPVAGGFPCRSILYDHQCAQLGPLEERGALLNTQHDAAIGGW